MGSKVGLVEDSGNPASMDETASRVSYPFPLRFLEWLRGPDPQAKVSHRRGRGDAGRRGAGPAHLGGQGRGGEARGAEPGRGPARANGPQLAARPAPEPQSRPLAAWRRRAEAARATGAAGAAAAARA